MSEAFVTTKERPNVIAPYVPLPWQIAPWKDTTSPVVLLTGSAGGGKSRIAAEKAHAFCLKYRNAFVLVVRKTRASLTKGTVLFLKNTIIGDDPRVIHRESKDYFYYPHTNSYLAYIGLEDEKQRERLKSIGTTGGVDFVFIEEATELEEADFNALQARMRGRAAPWRQIMLTCNPGSPLHWINQRLILGNEATVYYSSAKDNPHNPADYLDTLSRLTGVDNLRLNQGLWVQAEGVVYPTWKDGGDDGNVTEEADYIPGAGPVYWAVDDGYSAGSAQFTNGINPATGNYVADAHPRVILLIQQRPDGRLCVFAESYACLKLSDEHIQEVLEWDYPMPDLAVHGPGSAEIRGRLQAAGISPYQCSAQLVDSIPVLRAALAADKNGWRRILVHPRCRHLRAEMASYIYEPGQHKDKPQKAFDHGPDALRGLLFVLRDWI